MPYFVKPLSYLRGESGWGALKTKKSTLIVAKTVFIDEGHNIVETLIKLNLLKLISVTPVCGIYEVSSLAVAHGTAGNAGGQDNR